MRVNSLGAKLRSSDLRLRKSLPKAVPCDGIGGVEIHDLLNLVETITIA